MTDSLVFTVKNQEPFKGFHFHFTDLWVIQGLKVNNFHKLQFICHCYKIHIFGSILCDCLPIKVHIDIMGEVLLSDVVELNSISA